METLITTDHFFKSYRYSAVYPDIFFRNLVVQHFNVFSLSNIDCELKLLLPHQPATLVKSIC